MPRDSRQTIAIRWVEGFLAWWATWPAREHTMKMPNGTRTEVGLVARVAIMLYKLAQADGTLRGPQGGELSERYLAGRIKVSRPVLEQILRWLTVEGWLDSSGSEREVMKRWLIVPPAWEMPQGWPHVGAGQSLEYDSFTSPGQRTGGVWPTNREGLANETGEPGQQSQYNPLANTTRKPGDPETRSEANAAETEADLTTKHGRAQAIKEAARKAGLSP